jgi:hypothetical protein
MGPVMKQQRFLENLADRLHDGSFLLLLAAALILVAAY